MAFPVVEGTAKSSTNTAGTSHTVTLPANVAASDLVLITMDIGSTSATLNALADWTELLDEASANGLKILYYTGAGVPSNPTFTSSASTRDATISWRISGVNKSIAPQIGSTSSGTSATPDPPASAAPPSTKDYLFIAFAGMAGEEADDDTWGNTPPTNYTPNPPLQKSCGTAGTNLGGLILAASRQLNTGSAEDPGTFGVDVSAAWRAQTITVHPIIATTVTPGVLSLSIATFAPTVTATANQRVTPGVLALTTARFAPQLNLSVIPSTKALSLSAFAPTARVNNIAVPSTEALALVAFAPTASTPRLITPSVASLVTTAFAPTISTPYTVTPATAALNVTAFAPAVTLVITVVPEVATLAIATFAPTITIAPVNNNVTVEPSTANLTLALFAPTITVASGGAALSEPATASLVLTTYAATVTISAPLPEPPAVQTTISTTAIAWSGIISGDAAKGTTAIAWNGMSHGHGEVSAS